MKDVQGDTLTITRIGNGFLLNEHDTASDHDYGHMVTAEADGTLKVFTRPGGNAADDRVWYLTRVSAPLTITGCNFTRDLPLLVIHRFISDRTLAITDCRIGFKNTGPGKSWEWSDGTSPTFQLWLGSQGAIADNAGRDADARIRLDDANGGYGPEAQAGTVIGHWHDGRMSEGSDGSSGVVGAFMCERYE